MLVEECKMKINKVFICEDDLAIADMLKTGLELEDFNVMVETKSIFAFGSVQTFKPDIVIVDLQMPIVSGETLIQMIRQDRKLKNCFVLCITANDRGREIALDSGANMFIQKPFHIEQLTRILLSVVNAKNK